jgi:hypothetical protein
MYSFGMTERDIRAHLENIYNVEVSPELIRQVTSNYGNRCDHGGGVGLNREVAEPAA